MFLKIYLLLFWIYFVLDGFEEVVVVSVEMLKVIYYEDIEVNDKVWVGFIVLFMK